MKKAAKNYKLYIIAAALVVGGFGIPFGIYWITMIPSLNTDAFPFLYLLWIIMVVYVLLGFLISDIQIARWRHKEKEWDTKLPQEVKDKAWKIRYPFYLAAAVMLLICLFFEIWALIAGSYPLPGMI